MIFKNANKSIGPELDKLFQPIVDFPDVPISSNVLTSLTDIIYKNIGIKTKWHLVDHAAVDMAIMSKIHFGHQSTRYVSDPTLQHALNFNKNNNYIEPFKELIKIDLENFKVSGPLVENSHFDCFMFTGYFKVGFNARQITATILHECGHMFNTYMTLGEYAYTAYLIQQGVEDLANQKVGSFAVELMTDSWVKANVDKETYNAYINDRSIENIRKVVLGTVKNLPRFHLTDSTIAAKNKEEQLADSYPIKLGYGREIAEVANKMHKLHSSDLFDNKVVHYLTQLIKAPFLMVSLPIFYLLYEVKASSYKHKYSYDKPIDRLKNIKTTLISDLKQIQDDTIKKAILDDIDSIDKLIAGYYDNVSFIEAAMYFISPTLRRDHEKTLERLMNNDLFILSAKLR